MDRPSSFAQATPLSRLGRLSGTRKRHTGSPFREIATLVDVAGSLCPDARTINVTEQGMRS